MNVAGLWRFGRRPHNMQFVLCCANVCRQPKGTLDFTWVRIPTGMCGIVHLCLCLQNVWFRSVLCYYLVARPCGGINCNKRPIGSILVLAAHGKHVLHDREFVRTLSVNRRYLFVYHGDAGCASQT